MKTEDYTRLLNDSTEYFDTEKFYADNENGRPKARITGNGTLIEECAGEEGSWFASYITRPGSCFSVYREYTYKGLIRKKWAAFRNGGAVIGIRYEFDNTGKLCLREDEEKNFLFTPNDLITYCQKKSINVFSDNSVCISRYKNQSIQEFSYLINYKGHFEDRYGNIRIILNGKTGQTEEVMLRKADGIAPEIIFTHKK